MTFYPAGTDQMQRIHGTISIVSHGHGAMVRNLLEDFAKQDGIEDWLIVLTVNVPEEFNEVSGLRLRVIRNPVPKGFGANHNAAAVEAKGAIYAIVNPDIRLVGTDLLQRIAAMEWTAPQPALRAPIVVAPDGTREDSVRRNLSVPNLIARARRHSSGWEANPDKSGFFWLAGMFLVAPIDTFRILDGFDEGFRLYCEDYDLCARWKIAGGRVEIIRDLTVIHDARRDSHRSLRHLRWHLSSLARVWTSAPFWRIVLGKNC